MMNLRIMTKYGILILSVLTASMFNFIIIQIARDYYPPRSYQAVLIDMIVTVFVFVPVFSIVGKVVKKFSKGYLKTSKGLGRTRKGGFLVGFAIAFFLLFVAFAQIKYNLDFVGHMREFVPLLIGQIRIGS